VNPAVNAIVQLRGDEALAEARAADDVGMDRRSLVGAPVTISAAGPPGVTSPRSPSAWRRSGWAQTSDACNP
jgi:hypothetical protein